MTAKRAPAQTAAFGRSFDVRARGSGTPVEERGLHRARKHVRAPAAKDQERVLRGCLPSETARFWEQPFPRPRVPRSTKAGDGSPASLRTDVI
jgi:hypothetical protein